MSSEGEMPSDGDNISGKGASSNGELPSVGNMMSGETKTTYIPVGVTVHTTEDKETTFLRLASGDVIKILMETNAAGEEVIEEIWMLEL